MNLRGRNCWSFFTKLSLKDFLRTLRKLSWTFIFKISLFALILYSILELYSWANSVDANPWDLNYFLDDKDARKFENVVETPKCKILKLSPWDKGILPFIQPKAVPPDCTLRNRNWILLHGNKLSLNESALHAAGYSVDSVRCCYKAILRVEQTLEHYDINADNEVRYSDNCRNVGKGTEIEDEFIRVFCTSTSWPYGEVVYRNFFTVALPSKSALRKIKFWERYLSKNKQRSIVDKHNKTGEELTRTLPPSVVMIGMDSISRMNFHRSFNETKKFLKEIGSIEFLGYTKVGENTHPNTVAFLTGYSDQDLSKTCFRSLTTPNDYCPYIWKRFDEANYLTATVEDAPGLVGFNYNRLGFVNRPTDFYFRPFMLAVHKSLPRMDYYHTDCIGRLTTEETLLNYIQGITNHSSTVPVFVHSWMTSLAHLDINGGRYADPTIVKFLKSLDLSNTVLIFLSDHGQRYGAIRGTLAGWYEDKLPIFTIYLPPSVTDKFPSWKTSLIANSKLLTSPFDLYKTIDHILDSFTSTKSIPEEKEPESGKQISRKYGQSLFNQISTSRSCDDAGIAVNYCACVPPRKLNSSDPKVTLAAKEAVAYLNRVVPSQCEKLNLAHVSAGALLTDDNELEVTYVVTFNTVPGDFMFEANVKYDRKYDKFSINTDLLRMNSIVRDASCVKTSLLERYCYCS